MSAQLYDVSSHVFCRKLFIFALFLLTADLYNSEYLSQNADCKEVSQYFFKEENPSVGIYDYITPLAQLFSSLADYLYHFCIFLIFFQANYLSLSFSFS